jgi:hypothetical protein
MNSDTKRIGSEPIITRADGAYQQWVDERRAYVESLTNKWMFLIEGTKKQRLPPIAEKHWGTMAMLFENQVLATQRAVVEQTVQADVALPVTYSLPIIRKVFPNLVAMKVASIQPMPMSSGGVANIFYQDFLREDASDTSLTVPDSDYSMSSENAVPKRIKMQIIKATVTAEKRILGAVWSHEVAEDAAGALNIDVESELVQQMSLEILRELDQVILAEMLLWAGAGNVNWAWTPAAGHTNKEWYETLGHAVIDAEDLIYGQRFRSADWIIAGRNVVKYLRKMQDFKPEPRNQPFDPFALGVQMVGRVEGFWDVYLTSHINSNRAIVGVYPSSQTDTGYVFAPYIPLTPMPRVYAEFLPHDDATLPGAFVNTDKFSRNVRTRYGKKLCVPQLYATLSIAAS